MWVTPEQIEYARQTDLLTYLQNYEPNNLQRIGTGTYCTKEHDSLKISNGLWHWFSRHIGGKNALDYLIKVRGFSFTQAVMVLNNIVPEAQIFRKSSEVQKVLELPKFHSDIQRVKSYLMKRGIDERIIDYCYKDGALLKTRNTTIAFLSERMKTVLRDLVLFAVRQLISNATLTEATKGIHSKFARTTARIPFIFLRR